MMLHCLLFFAIFNLSSSTVDFTECYCPDGYVMEDDGLCWEPCQDEYDVPSPENYPEICASICPNEFVNYDNYPYWCGAPGGYGRGAGYFSKSKCKSKSSTGCEKYLLLWYPKCRDNYDNWGCCMCASECPWDTKTDTVNGGYSCQKMMYTRETTEKVCPSPVTDLSEPADDSVITDEFDVLSTLGRNVISDSEVTLQNALDDISQSNGLDATRHLVPVVGILGIVALGVGTCVFRNKKNAEYDELLGQDSA